MFLTRVSALIESRGITRNRLLLETGINTNAFQNWEKRGTVPSGDVVAKLADYFHVSTDYLLGRTDDPAPVGDGAPPSPLRCALLGNFDQLNQEGQERLVETSDDMVSSGKYKKSRAPKLGAEKDA